MVGDVLLVRFEELPAVLVKSSQELCVRFLEPSETRGIRYMAFVSEYNPLCDDKAPLFRSVTFFHLCFVRKSAPTFGLFCARYRIVLVKKLLIMS